MVIGAAVAVTLPLLASWAAWRRRARVVSGVLRYAIGADISVQSVELVWPTGSSGRASSIAPPRVVAVEGRGVELRDTIGRRLLSLPHVRVSLGNHNAGDIAAGTQVNIDVLSPPEIDVVFDNVLLTRSNLGLVFAPNHQHSRPPWWQRIPGPTTANARRLRVGHVRIAAGGRLSVRSAPHEYANIIPVRMLGGLSLSPVDLTNQSSVRRWVDELVAHAIQASAHRSLLSWASFGVLGSSGQASVPREARMYARRVLQESWLGAATRDGLSGARRMRDALGGAVKGGSTFARAERLLEQLQSHLEGEEQPGV